MTCTIDDNALRAHLHSIALESPDPRALAAFYARAMGFSFCENGDELVGAALDRRLKFTLGAARRLSEACYRVDGASELGHLKERLTKTRVKFCRGSDEQFTDSVRFLDPDGNPMLFAQGAAPEHLASEHPLAKRAARLQHLVLASSNAQRLIDFYRGIVGFRITDTVLDDTGAVRTAFLNCSHEHHSLAIFATRENRLDHFCFEAGDWGLIRDWADHFSVERIPLKWGPGRHGPGNNLFVFIHDLDGNWVEVSAELERVAPDRPAGTWRHEERTLNSWGVGLLRS